MNKYRLNKELTALAIYTSDNISTELSSFNISVKVFIRSHVSDRLVQRSNDVVRDLRNINNILYNLYRTGIGNILHHANSSNDTVLVYKKYPNNTYNCLALGCTIDYHPVQKDINVIIRTFMPDFELYRLKNKITLEVKEPKTYIRLANPLQNMIYSENCPEVLKNLRM